MTELQQRIIERIQREGPISFADYMRMALYEPGYGYYMSGAPKMGWQGDYFTSTDLSTLFASCVGRQLQRMWEQLNRPHPFVALEQGAGRGHLALGVLSWAEQEAPDFHAALDYRLEDMRTGQDARGTAARTTTLTTLTSPTPMAESGLEANISPSVILSNELIDAFPVHIVEKRGEWLYEVSIVALDGRLVETLQGTHSRELEDYLDRYRVPWRGYADGWRAEINLDALRWIERTSRLLRRGGFVFAIDYGEKAKMLYTRERIRGTLLCYYRHEYNERPLTRPGEQDITAHVNFSALIDEGRRHGLRLNAFMTQRVWLQNMGIAEAMERLRERDYAASETKRASDEGQVALLRWYSLRQRVSTLMDPAGMGNFKVLIMRRS